MNKCVLYHATVLTLATYFWCDQFENDEFESTNNYFIIHNCKFMEAQNNKVVLYIHYKQQEQAYMCVDQVELDLLNYLLVKIEYVCRVKARV